MTHQQFSHSAESPTINLQHYIHSHHILKKYRAVYSLFAVISRASSPYPNLVHTQNNMEQFTRYPPAHSEQATFSSSPSKPNIDNPIIIQYSSTTQCLAGTLIH
jgi:hypothetical protein